MPIAIDPTVISINGDRVSGQVQDLLRRVAVLERSGGAGSVTTTISDATTSSKGKIQLAGDLTGTSAAAPKVVAIRGLTDTSLSQPSTGQLQLVPTAATSASVSAGGALNILNTGNTGPGLVVYSNNGATQAGRLAVFNADNAAFDNAVVRIENAGTNAALSINNTGTSTSPSALDVTSTDRTTSAIGFQGAETGRATLKITHSHPAAASANDDSGAACLRLNWDDVAANGTAVQGIFASSEPGGPTTTGNLISMYPGPTASTLAMRLTAAGQLQLPVNGSTAGITMGTNLVMYRVATGQLIVEAATGRFELRLSAPDSGTLKEADIGFYDQESSTSPIWTIRKAAGSKPLQFIDPINARTPFQLKRQDGSAGSAKFVSEFTTNTLPSQTVGIDIQMTTQNVTGVTNAYDQICGSRSLLHAGGYAIVSGSQFADAATLTFTSTAEAPTSGTAKLLDDTGVWNTITYTGKTSTTLTGCSGAAGHNAVASGRAATFPATAMEMSPVVQVNEVTVAALTTPSASFQEPAHYFGVARDWTPSGSDHAQVWGFDTGVHGAVGAQNTQLHNAVFHINNHYNGSPTNTDAAGCVISTRTNTGAGGGAGPQLSALTYPVDCGLIITGTSGVAHAGVGFTTGIRIGGTRAAWFSDGTVGKVTTGIEVTNYAAGVKIHKRTSGTTNPSLALSLTTSGAASAAKEDGIEFGGDVNLYRSAANQLCLEDEFKIARGTGQAFRHFLNTTDTQPVFRIAGASGGLAWGVGGSTAVSTALGKSATTAALELLVGSTLTGTGTVCMGILVGPTNTGAFTTVRANYFTLNNPTLAGSAALTDGAVFAFDAAAGTHKAVDGNTTKTTPGGVDAWVKIDVNGTIYYMPAYTSKTA